MFIKREEKRVGGSLCFETFQHSGKVEPLEFVLPCRLLPLWDRLFERRSRSAVLWNPRSTRAEVSAWRGFTGCYADGLIGPVFETDLLVTPSTNTLLLNEGQRPPPNAVRPLRTLSKLAI